MTNISVAAEAYQAWKAGKSGKSVVSELLATAQRNRAEGWQFAKLSGHENELLIQGMLECEANEQRKLLERIGSPTTKIIKIEIGGLHETNVASVLGDTTKAKTDIIVSLSDSSTHNISLKKSNGGQAYMISVDRFIKGFELQYKKTVPQNIKRALQLFYGTAEDKNDIAKELSQREKFFDYELKHGLTATTLKKYDASLHSSLLSWFQANMREITDYCFSRGLATNESDWADFIWYRNLVEPKHKDMDEFFRISDICKLAQEQAMTKVFYGKVGGGTTIQLPWDYVQWHQAVMQFHHKCSKIKIMFNS